jgi:hypothetical protein
VVWLIYRPLLKTLVSTPVPYDADEEKQATKRAAPALTLNGTSMSWAQLLEVAKSMCAPKAWQTLTPELYTCFWSLSLYDLYAPVERYQSEIKRKTSEMKVCASSSFRLLAITALLAASSLCFGRARTTRAVDPTPTPSQSQLLCCRKRGRVLTE